MKREAWSTLNRSRVKIVHDNFSFPLLLLLKHIITLLNIRTGGVNVCARPYSESESGLAVHI